MVVWSLIIDNNFVIPKSLMIQKEFQLEVWILIIQKYTVIPPSSMVLFPIESVRDEIFDFFSTKGTMRWRLVQATALPS